MNDLVVGSEVQRDDLKGSRLADATFPFTQYAKAPGDLLENWEIFRGLARRMDLRGLDPESEPTARWRGLGLRPSSCQSLTEFVLIRYNTFRPDSALGYRPPAPKTVLHRLRPGFSPQPV